MGAAGRGGLASMTTRCAGRPASGAAAMAAAATARAATARDPGRAAAPALTCSAGAARSGLRQGRTVAASILATRERSEPDDQDRAQGQQTEGLRDSFQHNGIILSFGG
jgi:hypothetical protein